MTDRSPRDIIAHVLDPWRPADEPANRREQVQAADVIAALRNAGYVIVRDAGYD